MSGRVLINASNLHVGGGVQVAVSIIEELSRVSSASRLSVIASDLVARNLSELRAPVHRFEMFTIVNSYGVSTFWNGFSQRLSGFDAVYTIFGPLYVLHPPLVSIVGFAQPWIAYPTNDLSGRGSASFRLTRKLKFALQTHFFRRATKLVVELPHVKAATTRNDRPFRANTVEVISNCLHQIYLKPELWLPLDMPHRESDLTLGFVGRDYPHKNLDILPDVTRYLRSDFGIRAVFYVTLSPEEWHAKSNAFKASCINVGPISVAQCPSFYSQVDAIIFPSLLECFSATPLEALAMSKPLFASDRCFVRDVCGRHAEYFNPLEPKAIAQTIASKLRTYAADVDRLAAARRHALSYADTSARALKSLALVDSCYTRV